MLSASMLRLIAFGFVLFVALGTTAQNKPPDLNTLLDRVIERIHQEEANEKTGRELVATEHVIVEELKDDGSVKERAEYVKEPVLIDGHVYMRAVSRNGQALSGKYLDKERESEKRFREHLNKPKKDDDQDLKLDRDLFKRFLISIEGEENVNGRPAWVLQFHPKPGDKPERTRAERIVNHVAGKVWVDEQAYEIVRVDMSLTEPVSFYGIAGKVRSLRFQLEQHKINDLWTPHSTDLRLDARAVIVNLRQHAHTEYSNFRLRSELK